MTIPPSLRREANQVAHALAVLWEQEKRQELLAQAERMLAGGESADAVAAFLRGRVRAREGSER